MKIWAKVKLSISGIHHWPEAPKEQFYLANPHRHEFYIVVWIEQSHSDREVEYYEFRDWLNGHVYEAFNKPTLSCEAIAINIIRIIRERYVERRVKVEVTEDNQSGAVVEYEGVDERHSR